MKNMNCSSIGQTKSKFNVFQLCLAALSLSFLISEMYNNIGFIGY